VLIETLDAHKKAFVEIFAQQSSSDELEQIAKRFKSEGRISGDDERLIAYYCERHGHSSEEKQNFEQFICDYKTWGGGKTIDRADYFVSPILKSGNLLAETQTAIAELAYQLAANVDMWALLSNDVENLNLTIASATSPFIASSGFSRLPKPFILLAGISGTGKTRFVREQAKTSGQFTETFCLTSVRPDWHEPSDLLGYISRLNGAAEYVTTDVLQFIAKAWRAIADSGLTVEAQDCGDLGKRLVVSGERDALVHVLPYWLCLDE